MTTNQAKQILLAYRPWTNDAQDPEVAEALALCPQDAELAAWFENQRAVQAAIRARLKAMPVPEGLRQQIVSEYQARELTAGRWRRTTIATAAALLLVVAVVSLWQNLPRQPEPEVGFATYRNRMVRAIVRTYAMAMELETNDVTQVRAHLAQRKAPADYVLPRNLEQTQTVGCGALSWQGKPVTMVCFRTGKPLPSGEKSDLFLFVINEQDLASLPQLDAPQFARVSTLVTASWRAGGKVYVLAGMNEADVKERL